MSDEMDVLGSDIRKYKEKYGSVMDKADDADFVDELFETSDGKPVKNWSMEDINKLIEDVDGLPDIEQAGDDFEYDKYEEYEEPKNYKFGGNVEENSEEVYDENAVYFSEKYEKDLASKTENKEPDEFEDFSSFSENFDDENFSSIEGSINEARPDGEFRAIDEALAKEEYEQQNEVVYDGTFDRGDYLKIKDIFKNSKILSRRKAERAEVRESALETVKEKYGEAVFDAKKKEEDFNEILRRQRTVEKEKEEKKRKREKRFDIDSEDYIVTEAPATEKIEIKEDEELDDTIFIDELSDFEQVARSSHDETKVIGENPKTEDIYISSQRTENEEGQMRFEGFAEEDFTPKEVDADEVKENLRRTREEKKNLFRMTSLPDDYDDIDPNYFSPEKGKYDEEEYMVLSDENDPKSFFTMFKKSFVQEKNKKFTEYTTPNERPQVFKELYDKRRRSVFGLIAMTALTLVFVIVQIVLDAAQVVSGDVQSAVTVSLSLAAMLLTFVFGSSVTQPGLQGLIKKSFNVDSAVTVLIFVSVITSAVMFFDLSLVGEMFPIYTSAVLVSVIINCIGRIFELSRAINALKCATAKRQNNLFTVQKIDDEETAENIARIFAGTNPDLKYSCKTAFPSGFIANSFSQNPADRFVKIFFPAAAILSLIIAVISGIVNKSVPFAFSSFTVCLLLSYPVSLLPALNISLYSLNKNLGKKNACITGYSSTLNIEKTNAVVVNSTDLFDVGKCNFHGMKDYGTVRVDDIILYAAAMLMNSRGPLAHVFDKAIIGDKAELLPEVEDLCYEERLGLSGWIRGEKVFVGNRNLLINHNMEAPPKGAEIACLKEGKKVLYIAIDGKVAAMLVVEYAKNEEMKKYLGKLDKNGITIVVTTNDCNIDEDFLSLEFNLPRESFKVVGDYDGGLLDGYINRMRKSAPAKLIHDGTPESFFKTLTSAISYSGSIKMTLVVQVVLMLLALIVTGIFAISGKLSVMSCGVVVLIEILISVLLTTVASVRAKM